MLFLVEMDVRIPHDTDPDAVERLKAEERARAQDLQRGGEWRHLWRVAGRYANVSVFDVGSVDRLHELLSELPLYPYLDIRVTPLATHPSAIEAQDG
ncbi:MAG: muconolactone Delta-isomerase [Streptosporangiales bacterium]|nr:muconolactone Delta-isomerase [Streptosporangiales bacterium]